MGCDSGYWGGICLPQEQPLHEVTLTPYFIDKYEVTNDRYRACVDAGVCAAPRIRDAYDDVTKGDHPVRSITQSDAEAFCEWDGGRDLPTEAQWEKAARGPSPGEDRYVWGSAAPDCVLMDLPCGDGEETPVGTYTDDTSYWGVQDLLFSVMEFCRDWYEAGYYSVSPTVDPLGPSTGDFWKSARAYANDDWSSLNRVTFRGPVGLTYQSDGIGFRCVREIAED
jgi:formylglycine-generating enzyme required for sulfatase activity